MRISEQQLQLLFQIAVDSIKIEDVGQDLRGELVKNIINQQNTELINIDDEKPTLKPQYYKEGKKTEEPKTREHYLKKAVDLLRRWRSGDSGGANAFLRTTNTIKFLDEYDKAVFLKE